MIQANELRIGNWVKDDNTYYRVTPPTIEAVWEAERLWVQPIPLTEEILLKCDEYNKYYGFCLNDLTYLNFTFMKDGVYPFIIQEQESKRLGSELVHLERIEYIHQWQNLYFALAKKELEINL